MAYSLFWLFSCLYGSSRSTCEPYTIHTASQTSVATHISTLHAAMVAHIQVDPLSELHDITARARKLLWSLPLVAPWHQFRLRYDDFMFTGGLGPDAKRFQILGAWFVITGELSLREELELRGVSYDLLPFIFPALDIHPAIVPPHLHRLRDHSPCSLSYSHHLVLHRLA